LASASTRRWSFPVSMEGEISGPLIVPSNSTSTITIICIRSARVHARGEQNEHDERTTDRTDHTASAASSPGARGDKCYQMSKGPGEIERRTAGLFAATRDRGLSRGLSVAEIADHAFDMGGGAPTRAQRLRRQGLRIVCCERACAKSEGENETLGNRGAQARHKKARSSSENRSKSCRPQWRKRGLAGLYLNNLDWANTSAGPISTVSEFFLTGKAPS
jgi:hypothetical protein